MLVLSPIKIDLRKQTLREAVYAVQNDSNTRGLELTLVEGESSWNIPVDTTAAISFRKPDGTSGLYDTLPDGVTKAVEITQNKVTAIFAPQVLTCPGRVDVSLILFDSLMNRLGTFPIPVFVSEDPSAGQGISNDYYNFQTLAEINAALANRLSLYGGTMQGPINMNGQALWGLGNPTGYDQPVPYQMILDLLAEKAPAGYGLGDKSTYISDVNNAVANGWYYTDPSTANIPDGMSNYADIFVKVRGDSVAQCIRSVTDNTSLVRHRVDSNSEYIVEWENPPMVPNVEYRTTERYNDKPVYAKLVQSTVGAVDAEGGHNDFKVYHGVTNYGDTVRQAAKYNGTSLPAFNSAGGFVAVGSITREQVQCILYHNSISGGVFEIDLRYTKSV